MSFLRSMKFPSWLTDMVELAELLLEIGPREDVERTLRRLEAEEISI